MSTAEILAAILALPLDQQKKLLNDLHDAVYHPTFLAEPS